MEEFCDVLRMINILRKVKIDCKVALLIKRFLKFVNIFQSSRALFIKYLFGYKSILLLSVYASKYYSSSLKLYKYSKM